MTAPGENASLFSNAADREDLAGRKRLTYNVLTSWGGYLVYIAAGLVMPRMIDRHAGQAALGIWDFGFSAVVYLTLAQLGVGVAINRFVSTYRATGDVTGLNRAVSSAMAIQLVAAAVALVVTAVAVVLLPSALGPRFGPQLADAQWVLAVLGVDVAVIMAFDVYRGVLTGCHRWDVYNGVEAATYSATIAAMIIALLFGADIRVLAVLHLLGDVVRQWARAVATHKVCPELRIRLSDARWSEAREMLGFGGKAAVQVLSRFVLLQGNSLVVAAVLGPTLLAVYARPGALVRHVETLINKLAFVLVPTASSLQAAGDERRVRELLVSSARYAAGLTLPIMLLLAILGDHILELWMGPHYRQGAVLAVLALGHVLPLTQQPAISILRGLNVQGPIVVTSLVSSAVGLVLGAVLVGMLEWQLMGAAVAIAVPLSLGNGVAVAVMASRRAGMTLVAYGRVAFVEPLACCIPFAGALLLIRAHVQGRPVAALGLAAVAGVVLLLPIYWRFLMPPTLRSRVLRMRLWRRGASDAATAPRR
jgi:O-antigen/teichoic acid export membrane protein